MLTSRLGTFDGLRVADLFAGSGAFGFEALSRGASFACFVETDSSAGAAIKANAADLGASDQIRLVMGSALALPKCDAFDMIFADPPYQPGSGSAAVRAAVDADWLAHGGWLAIETERGEPVNSAGLLVDCERDVGRARLTLLRRP